MNNPKFPARLQSTAINLAPSAIILALIALGAALQVPWFELSWRNDVLFVLLALAALLPLTKLPLLFLTAQDAPLWPFGAWAGASAQEHAAQIELLQQYVKDSSLAVGDSTPALAVGPSNPKRIAIVNEKAQVFRSDDGGVTWGK